MLSKSVVMTLYQSHWAEGTAIESVGPNFQIITLPLLNQDNDFIEIIVQNFTSGCVFTDGGDTIDRLISTGVNIKKPGNEGLIKEILDRYGLACYDNEIFTKLHANKINKEPELVPAAINIIAQAILAIEAAFYYTRIPGQPLPGSKK